MMNVTISVFSKKKLLGINKAIFKNSTVHTVVYCALALTTHSSSLAWSPGAGAEQSYFTRYVYESLNYVPQTPNRNWQGQITSWNGPTLQQQLNSENSRQMNNANRDAQTVNSRNQRNQTNRVGNPVDNQSRSMNQMRGAIQTVGEGTNRRAVINDPRVLSLGASQSEAAARVNQAQNMVPNGPTATQTARLSDRRTAGGQLDRNGDGVISKGEREFALSNRTSMKSQRFSNPRSGIQERKLDANGNGTIENYGGVGSGGEWQVGLQNVTGATALNHNAMLAQRQIENTNYTTPDVNKSSTYTDSRGNVLPVAGLNSQENFQRQFDTQVTARRNQQASRPIPTTANDLMAAASTRGVGSGRVPTTVTSSSRVTTGGTWGRTYTDSKTYNVARDTAVSQSSTGGRLSGQSSQGVGDRVNQIRDLETEVRGSFNY